MRKRSRSIFAVILAMFLFAGCAKLHRTPNPSGPTAPVTALEQVNFDNLQIASHNRAVAEGLVIIQQQGFIEREYFDKLSAAQIKITRIHQQLTPLLKNPSVEDSAKIKALLQQMGDIAQEMVNNGTAGIKNPQAQLRVVGEVRGVIALANSIMLTLTTAGILK